MSISNRRKYVENHKVIESCHFRLSKTIDMKESLNDMYGDKFSNQLMGRNDAPNGDIWTLCFCSSKQLYRSVCFFFKFKCFSNIDSRR